MAAVVLAAGGTVPAAAPAQASQSGSLTRVAWVCYADEEGAVVTGKKSEDDTPVLAGERWAILWQHIFCVNTVDTDVVSVPQVDLSGIRARYPHLSVFQEEERIAELGAVQCGKRGVDLLGATPGRQPTAADLAAACAPTPPGASGYLGTNSPGPVGGVSRPGEGMPSADSVDCSTGGLNNPYAAGTTERQPKNPGAWGIARDVTYHTAFGATVVGGTLSAGVLAPIVFLLGFDQWEKGVVDEFQRYGIAALQDEAYAFAGQANRDARSAEGMAAEAQALAPGSPEAERAAAAARKARTASDEANRASTKADKSTGEELLNQHAEADKARKKAAEAKAEAGCELQQIFDAKKKKPAGPTGATGQGGDYGGGEDGGNGTLTDQEACEQLRKDLWECEQNGWSSFDCQKLADMFKGCQIDRTVALIGPDGDVCQNSREVDPDKLQTVLDRACGLPVAQHDPDSDPCNPAVGELKGDLPSNACDPTVAHNGCPDATEGRSPLPDNGVTCLEPAPDMPPLPCFDTDGPDDPRANLQARVQIEVPVASATLPRLSSGFGSRLVFPLRPALAQPALAQPVSFGFRP